MAGILIEGPSDVPRCNILVNKLIKERSSVLFVGEGDFSFTVAFAALREFEQPQMDKSMFDSITSTCCYAKEIKKVQLDRVVRRCISECKCLLGIPSNEPASDIDQITEQIEVLQLSGSEKRFKLQDKMVTLTKKLEKDLSLELHYSIDGRSIPDCLLSNVEVIWFQCPWRLGGPHQLIIEFFEGLAEKISEGVLVCIGITTHHKYFRRYDLQTILSTTKQSYEFLGADKELVDLILKLGYHHEGWDDIHDYIKEYHKTLIFKKRYTTAFADFLKLAKY
jgi:hypothetical protein